MHEGNIAPRRCGTEAEGQGSTQEGQVVILDHVKDGHIRRSLVFARWVVHLVAGRQGEALTCVE